MFMALFLLVGVHFNVGNRVIMSFVINAKNEVKIKSVAGSEKFYLKLYVLNQCLVGNHVCKLWH